MMAVRKIRHKSNLPYKTQMRLRAAVRKVLRNRRGSKASKTALGEALTMKTGQPEG